MSDELYCAGYSHIWEDMERLQKENAALKQTLEFTVNDAFESRETLAFLKRQHEGLCSELERVKGLLDIFLFEGSSAGRRYGLIWKRREELRKQHGLD
jgi:hypothetical protein